jgi:cyclic beta-1,2-glucan synthetase
VPPTVIAEGRPCKRRLWGRGISGDDPILLVRVHDAQSPMLREAIAAQSYLRSCGVRLDLVLVDQEASGYSADGAAALRAVVADCGAEQWLGRHAGIYTLVADQLPGEERMILEASARAVLDTNDGSIAARFRKVPEGPPRLPHLAPTLVEDPSPAPQQAGDLRLPNGFGGFSADGREYVVVVRPGKPVPAPWCNVLANPDFGCLVSESSLGCTWSANSGENRLTPWRNDPVHDLPSEALYLRDEETAAVWSPTPLPAGQDADTRVTHGAGYTTYTRESHGLVQELTIFVPPDAPVKVARLRLRNTRARHRRLTATYYVEWVLGGIRGEQAPYVVPEVDRGRECLLARCSWNEEFAERVAFLASGAPIHGFTTDRGEFLGRRGD